MTDHADAEVVDLLVDLIRFAAVNTGDVTTIGDGETRAIRYIQAKLEEVGYHTSYAEKVPGRGNLVCRLPGADPSRGALLIHGHVDVVPANPADWTVDPFLGVVQDGYVWGRGAVDMLDMVAMTVVVARDFKRRGVIPPRDLIFAFVSDEEAGGRYGAGYLVEEHPEWFTGATEAISEVGGFSVPIDQTRRAYLVACAEKGISWAKLTATGTAGHGSMIADDNAVVRLAAAVAAIGAYEFPITRTRTVDAFLAQMSELTGLEFSDDDLPGTIAKLGPVARVINSTLRNTANPTMLQAGYKSNVIPGSATAHVDCRIVPGQREAFKAMMAELVGDGVDIDYFELTDLEYPTDGPLMEAMRAAIVAEDPDGVAVPYMLSAGTDNKHFAKLGIAGYGFAPLRLPADLDFTALFHGVDERVPVDALHFGLRVLDRLLRQC